MVVICSFVVFITLKAGPWNYFLTLNRCVAQKRLGTTGSEHEAWRSTVLLHTEGLTTTIPEDPWARQEAIS